jgi:PadR family transcriptional regulator, regulatory protein AphA
MNAPRAEPAETTEATQAGMPAEHALLGLLAMRETESGHGYELARSFGSDAPLGNVIRLEPGMVYHHLKKLERLGWVTVLPDAAPERPARRPFALSQSGREELLRWLAEPVAHTREIRLEFLVKLYLALVLDPALAMRLIDEQREMCSRLIESLSEQRRHGRATRGDDFGAIRFGEMVLDMRLAQTEAALAWLDRVRREAAAVDVAASGKDVPGT